MTKALMWTTVLAATCCFLVTLAFAQIPQPQQQSPAEQALAQKLGQEMSENISLRAQIIKLQEELKAKTEPKPDDKTHPEGPASQHK